MSTAAATVLGPWRVCGDLRVDSVALLQPRPANPATAVSAPGAAVPAKPAHRAWRWAVEQMKRLAAPREPQTRQEVLAYANSIENTMPNQAAELRFLVMRQADLED